MKPKLCRRDFLTKCSVAGLTGCGLALSYRLSALDHFTGFKMDEEIDPKKLEYCGYKCPEECQLLKGSLENNIELKKEAYELWKIKERYDVDFDADKIFCYGCKTMDKPEGIVLENCTVRSCAISKEYDCCIECKELADCDKDLWTRFPEFRKQMVELQKQYLEQKK